MSTRYAYDHAWAEERLRLSGLELALDPGTRHHLKRIGLGPGWRCIEVGAGGGSIAFWMAEQVAPRGVVVATDLETDFLEREGAGRASLEVLRHDINAEALPTGFDLVHTRWLVEWLPDKRAALRRMRDALRPGGWMLVEEPDFVTLFAGAESAALRRVVLAAMRHLESTCPVEVEYGRRLLGDLDSLGLADLSAEGRVPLVRGGSPPAAHFLRLTVEKFRVPVLESGVVGAEEFDEAMAVLQDPRAIVPMPMTVAAWGRRE